VDLALVVRPAHIHRPPIFPQYFLLKVGVQSLFYRPSQYPLEYFLLELVDQLPNSHLPLIEPLLDGELVEFEVAGLELDLLPNLQKVLHYLAPRLFESRVEIVDGDEENEIRFVDDKLLVHAGSHVELLFEFWFRIVVLPD